MADEAAVRAEIEALFAVRAAALVRADADYFRRLLEPAFVYTNASGAVFGREDYLAFYLESGRARWRSQEWAELEVRLAGGVAVATALLRDRAAFDGVSLDAHFRTTQVFVRRDGEWRYLAGHSSAAEG